MKQQQAGTSMGLPDASGPGGLEPRTSTVPMAFFEPVFRPLTGRKVGLVTLHGSVENRLIARAAEQLMMDFGVRYRYLAPKEIRFGLLEQPVDHVLLSGGDLNDVARRQRAQAHSLGKPVTMLPHSVTGGDGQDGTRDRVFVRERASLALVPGAQLAPDLSLGMRAPWIDEGIEAATGIWLREGPDAVFPGRAASLGDPVGISHDVEDYIGLASKFERLVTDRLQFAIAGLLLKRKVVLLPDRSAVNRSMYETWLRPLGCRWRWTPDAESGSREAVVARLWKRLSAAPSSLPDWSVQPRLHESLELVPGESGATIRRAGEVVGRLNPTSAMIVSLLDGTWTVEDLCLALAEQFQQPLLDVGRQVQDALKTLRNNGLLEETDGPQTPLSKATARIKPAGISIEVLPRRRIRGLLRLSANVRGTARGDLKLFFDGPPALRGQLTARADPFLLAVLPRAMREGKDIRVHGAEVDQELLENLDEFQQVWHSWNPNRYRLCGIDAETACVRSRPDRPAALLFSGGVDSTYSMLRHRLQPDGRRNRSLELAVSVCGFDISIHDRDGFDRCLTRLTPVAQLAGIPLHAVATNIRTLFDDWEHEHGPALAAVLHLFGGRYGAGLIASTMPYTGLAHWGSSALTDGLLGGALRIRNDGAGVSRFDKIRAIAKRPDVASRLRVCWTSRDPAENCGRCVKCLNLAIALQALDIPLDCFRHPPSPEQLRAHLAGIRHRYLEINDFSSILQLAVENRVRAGWIEVLQHRLANPG